MTPLPPGATLGLLGGGQLGRMFALAARPMGYRVHLLAPEPESPATSVVVFQWPENIIRKIAISSWIIAKGELCAIFCNPSLG